MESIIEINAVDQLLFNRIVDFIYDNQGGNLWWHDKYWYMISVMYDDDLLTHASVVRHTLTDTTPFAPSLIAAIVSNYNSRYVKKQYNTIQ
jgi:hypothetical protein